MSQHHPDIHFLTEYAAGTLDPAYALCVSAHLEHCDRCRGLVSQLTEVGASLFQSAPNELERFTTFTQIDSAPHTDSLAKLFSTIDALGDHAISSLVEPTTDTQLADGYVGDLRHSVQSATTGAAPLTRTASLNSGLESLGRTVTSLVSGDAEFSWEKVGRFLQIGRIRFADKSREVALHRLSPGGKIGVHNHRGNEITVILEGSFSDENGVYQAGDFLFKTPGDTHQPIASNDGICTCLTVLDAPIKFTQGLHRLLNPFLKLRPRFAF